MIEVTVKIKTDDVKLSKSFCEYEPFLVSHDDPKLKSMVEETIKQHNGELFEPDIFVVVKYLW